MYEHDSCIVEAESEDFEAQLTGMHDKKALENWELVCVTALPLLDGYGNHMNIGFFPSKVSFLITYRRKKK
jgi:hypothetical protein